jgi:hypothetical protein
LKKQFDAWLGMEIVKALGKSKDAESYWNYIIAKHW